MVLLGNVFPFPLIERMSLEPRRTRLLATIDCMRKMEQRLDARITGVRDELELIIKSELMGRLAHFETRMEQMVEQRLAERRPE